MKKALVLLVWMLVCLVAQAGDDIEPLDGDFLDYLANMEGEDDNWTLVEDADRKAVPAADSKQWADRPETPKSNKEAAKPAVEEQ